MPHPPSPFIMPKFLLISVPICTLDHHYYAAAYVAAIIKKTGWNFSYLDFNLRIFYASGARDLDRELWQCTTQLELLKENRELAKNIFRETFAKEFANAPPSLIGFSLMSPNRHYAYVALEALHELNSTIPVIYGGPDCFPSEYSKEYFNAPLTPDIMLQGEAEIALPLFLDEFQRNGNHRTTIGGFVYKDANGGLKDTGLPKLSYLKKDPIQADYTIFDRSLKVSGERTLYTFTSKGCINKCAFCSESRNYRPFRRRDAKDVLAELENNIKSLPNPTDSAIEVTFRDSIFNATENYVVELCNLILEKKLNIRWHCLGAFKTGLTTELIELMHRAGCFDIFFGFESASQRVIDLMVKDFDITNAQDVIGRCIANDISVTLPIINGFPGEGVRDFLTNVAFILKYRETKGIHFGYSNTCGIQKGTPLYEFPHDFLIEDKDENNFTLRDHYNTSSLRQFRQVITTSLMQNKDIESIGDLMSTDFNDCSVGLELALTFYFLTNYLGTTHVLPEIFFLSKRYPSSTDPGQVNAGLLPWRVDRAIPLFNLNEWFSLDKNRPEVKKELLYFLKCVIEDFRNALSKQNKIDMAYLRSSFYRYPKLTESNVTLADLDGQMTSIRLSEYDKGRNIIFEGVMKDSVDSIAVSRIEGKCGEYLFDIHHGVANFLTCGYPKRTSNIGFWGKVKKSAWKSDGFAMKIILNDNSARIVEMPYPFLAKQSATLSQQYKGIINIIKSRLFQ